MRKAPILTCGLLVAFVTVANVLPAGAAEPAASSSCARQVEAAVKAVLATQTAAWNRGDLEGFTSGYSEDTAFLSPSGLTRGRREVLARYKKRYPDQKTMGILTLDVQEVRVFESPGTGKTCASGASLAARWRLDYPDQPEKKSAEGATLLVLRPRGESWEIVEDASM